MNTQGKRKSDKSKVKWHLETFFATKIGIEDEKINPGESTSILDADEIKLKQKKQAINSHNGEYQIKN